MPTEADDRALIPTKQAQRDLDAVRPGLEAWLRARVSGGLSVRDIRLPKGAGVANETLMVDAVVGGRETGYVVRVGAADQHLYLDSDLHTHFRMYEVLQDEPDVPTPAVIGFEASPALFGQPFFVMERIEGLVPADNPSFYDAGWVTELSPQARREMWRGSIAAMAKLHRLDPAKFAFLQRPELGATGLEQEFRFWLGYAKWCGGERYPIVQRASAWLEANLPADPPPGLSWGDARPSNIIYQGVTPAAVLDWDTVSLAGGENDIAWWALMDAGGVRARAEGRFAGWGSAREALQLWEEQVGRRAAYVDWHLVFNAFRLRLIMTRLPHLLHQSGALTAEQRDAMADGGQMEQVAMLLDRPLAPRHETAWPGWDA